MNKREFLNKLSEQLEGYNKKNELLDYYDEIIYDRVNEGYSEEAVIKSFGSIESIVYKATGNKTREEKKVSRIVYTERFDREAHIEKNERRENNKNNTKKKELCVWKVLLVIILIPTIISLLIGLASGIIGLTTGLFAGGASGLLGGVIGAIKTLFMFDGLASLGNLGLSLLVIAFGLLFIYLGINFIFFIINCVKWLFRKLGEAFKDGGWFYES